MEPRPRYLPFLSGRFRLAMGLMSLDPEEWIEPDGNLAAELAEKDRLFAERHGEVVQARPGSGAAQAELLDLLAGHMARRHPEILARDGGTLALRPTGRTYRVADWRDAPIDLAGRLVQEDFLLMRPGADGYTLEAASLCFPSRWRLAEKMGRPLAAIHRPVPGYADRLERPVDRFFDRLDAGRPVWRVNWSVLDDPALFQPVRRRGAAESPVAPEEAGARLHLRCERQTLRRLPETGWAVFGVKTHVDPLSTLAGRPEACAALAAAVRSLPEGTRAYKAIGRFEPALLAWLDAAAAARPPAPTPPPPSGGAVLS